MAGLRAPAAPDEDVQALDRSNFVAKERDVVGLYVSPPEHAIVLCVDELPNPGAGPQSAHAADASRPAGPKKP